MKLVAAAILVLAVAVAVVGWRMSAHSSKPSTCVGYSCSPGYDGLTPSK